MSERDDLAKGEALRRLSEPEGDHALHAALAGMRESHPHLWDVIHRVHLSRDADPAKLEEWRRRRRVARRTSGRHIMMRPWGSWQ